jgi:peptide/nickel transport system ATP-binding protein
MPLLSIHNLSVGFETEQGFTQALQNVSFDVNSGEIVALVGESGSGKSVTSLSILQLLTNKTVRYTQGSIVFQKAGTEAVNLLQLKEQQLQQLRGNDIAMIFQEPMTSLNPVFTCGHQVMEAIRLHQQVNKLEAKQKTLSLFNQMQLPNPNQLFNRYPHQLSGGQKQRVMIAMAISCQPALLICDEPTTALDVTVQKTILQLLKALQQNTRMGIIFITHDLGVVSEIANRVVVLYRGSIVEQGATTALLKQPQHPYTKGLLACRPILHKKGERLPVVSDFLKEEANCQEKKATNNRQTINLIKEADPLPVAPQFHNTENVLVSVRNLKVWYPAKKNFWGKTIEHLKAVDDVSFDIYRGETMGLVGESGCGKTTLGRALLRLVEPVDGKINFHGKNLLAYTPKQLKAMRKNIQIVFQDPYSSLNPRLTIGDAIQEVLEVHRLEANHLQQKEKVIELLEKVSLPADYYYRYPHEFSGGQRQRIVIARALSVNPYFVVCDESISALDVSVQAQVLNLLNDLKDEFGFTVVFISHDLGVVHYMSDRIMVMEKGTIVEAGSAEEVFHRPKQPYTKQLMAALPKH